MLNYPEFSNVERAREFLKLMVEKDLISRVLKDANSEKDKIVIKIGHENDIEEMKECSLITTTYTAGDVVIGTIGIIGPTRMEYSKVYFLLYEMYTFFQTYFLKLLQCIKSPQVVVAGDEYKSIHSFFQGLEIILPSLFIEQLSMNFLSEL